MERSKHIFVCMQDKGTYSVTEAHAGWLVNPDDRRVAVPGVRVVDGCGAVRCDAAGAVFAQERQLNRREENAIDRALKIERKETRACFGDARMVVVVVVVDL